MSQIVFHRPYRRQRQHSNVIFKIRQTEGVFGVHVCSLLSPPLHSVERLFTCNRSGISSFFPINGQNSISWGVAGVILEKRENCTKLYLSIFLGQFPGERLMNFHLNRYFRISHLSQSLLIFLLPLPSCPFWYLAVHKVYISPQFRISVFFSPSLSLWLSLLVLGLLVLDGMIFISYCSARCGWRVGVEEQNLK